MADATPTEVFWPTGWSRERLVHATGDELRTLTPEDSDRMFNSLRTSLGTAGYKSLVEEMTKIEEARKLQDRLDRGLSANPLDDLRPEARMPVLSTLNEYLPEGPWGWVAYRTCCYNDDEKWKAFLKKFDEFFAKQIEPHIYVPEIKAAQDRFRVHWVDRPELENAGVNAIAAEYRKLIGTFPSKTMPEGLAHQICLKFGESEVQSLLGSPIPTPNPIHEQLIIPYATLVDMYAGEDPAKDEEDWEEHGHSTSFKVALSALSGDGDLFRIMLRTTRSPRELSVGFSEDNIVYLNVLGRWGRFKLGESQGEEAFLRRRY